MRLPHSILCLLVVFPISCASDSGSTKPEPLKPFSQRINESNGYKQDAEGNWLPKTDKRSSFENQGRSAYFKGEYGRKTYKTEGYSKKSWWGNKDYVLKEYSGDTDGSRFQKTSGLTGKGARETGRSAGMSNAYQTDGYATGPARETGAPPVEKSSDAETDIRRKVYPAPEIIDWQEQRTLSLEQSKGILGR